MRSRRQEPVLLFALRHCLRLGLEGRSPSSSAVAWPCLRVKREVVVRWRRLTVSAGCLCSACATSSLSQSTSTARMQQLLTRQKLAELSGPWLE